jgi:hypothetical protein
MMFHNAVIVRQVFSAATADASHDEACGIPLGDYFQNPSLEAC